MSDPSLLNPELGDCVTVVYHHKKLTGYIIYRDASLIRIRPEYVINMATDFPMDPETGTFLPEAGVTEVIVHEKAADYHFAVQLGVFPGDRLEFYQMDGTSMNDGGEVAQVIATEEEDKIVLTNGRVLDFQFLGVPPPIGIIMPTSTEEAEPENNEAEAPELVDEEPTADEQFPDIDDVAAVNLVEEIATSEVTYSDSIQREAMFVDMLIDTPAVKQKDPRVLRNLYRKTDILLALKNSVLTRNDTGTIVPNQHRSYLAKTVQEALAKQPVRIPLAALLPVAAVKKVLYIDKAKGDDETDADVDDLNYDDLDVRRDFASLSIPQDVATNWLQALNDTLYRTPAFVSKTYNNEIIGTDQDVLRSIPNVQMMGLPSGFPTSKMTLRGEGRRFAPPLTSEYIQGVNDRSGRLLSPTFIVDPVSRQRIQLTAGDTAATTAHILLSKDLTEYRSPTRSSILLWDVLSSEKSRKRTKVFYALIQDSLEKQVIIRDGEEQVNLAEQLCKRVEPSLNFMSRSVITAVDSLGLKSLEFDSDLMNCLATAIQKGCEMWDRTFQQLMKRSIESLQSGEIAPIFPLSDAGSALWNQTVMENKDIQIAMDVLAARETSLLPTTSAKAAFLFSEANQTLSALWYRLASKATDEAVVAATQTYRAERVRLERNQLNKQAENAKIAAQPELNPCVHVHELEVIMNIRNDARRMKLLRRFIDRMKAGIQDNWIICRLCDQHLICKHEILLMEEFNHPGRGDKLHKSLLLDFAAPIVFEGAYICKNCGQKISELEYDTSMEFDDDGRPMVGRTVLEEETMDAAAATAGADDAAEGEEGDMIVIKEGSKEHSEQQTLIRTVVEYCGIIALPELMERVTNATADYTAKNLKSETAYKKIGDAAIAAQKTEKMKDEMRKKLPSYAQYLANSKIVFTSAFVILEILTQKTAIPFPAVGCKFVRSGYPLTQREDTDEKIYRDDSVFKYVSCVVASINKSSDPWVNAQWSKLDLEPRKAVVMQKVLVELKSIVTKAASAPSVETYKVALDGVVNAEGVKKDLPSMFDRLPLQFRPIPNPEFAGAPNENAIQNVQQFQKDLATAAVTEIAPYIKDRQQQILQRSLKSLHETSAEFLKGAGQSEAAAHRSDSSCCFKPLAEVAVVGNGLLSMQNQSAVKEMELLENAEAVMRHRDPAASCCGTHIMVPWFAPAITSEMATPDSDTYYRLFLKHCFRGDNKGRVHEFNIYVTESENVRGHRCRHCMFVYPEALTWLTMANVSETNSKKLEAIIEGLAGKRKELSLQAFVNQQVTINEQTFHELEDTIRLFKNVPQPAIPSTPTILSDLEDMYSVLKTAPVLPNAEQEFLQFTEIMSNLFHATSASKREDGIVKFILTFNSLATYFEATLRQYNVENPEEILMLFASMTENMVSAQAARNVHNLIVTEAEKIANEGYTPDVEPTKWIPRISDSHKQRLKDVWKNQSKLVMDAATELRELPDNIKIEIRRVLRSFTSWMGRWMQFWVTNLRTAPNFHELESRYFLRWSVLTGFVSITNPLSPLLNTLPQATLKAALPYIVRLFADLVYEYKIHKKYQMTLSDIDDSIHDKREREKRLFIKHFDDLDNEMRKVELINKKLGLGFFAEAKAKAGRYDADVFDIESHRLTEMGVEDFSKIENRRQRQAEIGNDHRDRADEDS